MYALLKCTVAGLTGKHWLSAHTQSIQFLCCTHKDRNLPLLLVLATKWEKMIVIKGMKIDKAFFY